MTVLPQVPTLATVPSAGWNAILDKIQNGTDLDVLLGQVADNIRIVVPTSGSGTDADPYPAADIQTALAGVTPGGLLIIPEGTWEITTTSIARADASNIQIIGVGRGTIIKVTSAVDGIVIGDGSIQEGFILSNLRIVLATSSAVKALRLRSQRHAFIQNLRVFGNATSLNQTGISLEGSGSNGSWVNTILHPIIGACHKGIDLVGSATAKVNAISIIGGTVTGHSSLPAASVGVRWQEGDTLFTSSLDIEQFETGIEFNTNARESTHIGLRIEQCTTGISVTDFGAQVNRFFGGDMFSSVTTKLANSGGATIRFVNMVGFVTQNRGAATILNGQSSIVVNHGLHTTPTVVLLTGQHGEVKDAYVTSPGGTQFTITVDASVTANRTVYWLAKTIYRT